MRSKPGRHAGRKHPRLRLDFLSTLEECLVACGPIAPGQQCVARSSAGWCLHVMGLKEPPSGGQGIDVRILDVIDSITVQLRTKIIDANEKHIGPRARINRACSNDTQKASEEQGMMPTFHRREDSSLP